ncbi:NUDIX hydrolase [Enterococcus sp. CSURQ0835]|uniref:NUDIX hydrolase n=1 Tax=Enterococcus sp. CSURQ0835 TaxID=2681394 RepID=UPI0013580781|nr:NUDIX hydrolase [Enterococcus sp. CSURQ0835]
MTVPTFGQRIENQKYQARYAAYVVLENEHGEIALVQAPNGAYFLPGGEIEGTETKEAAIEREMMEELGFTVTLGKYLGQADEYFFSRHRDTYFYNPGYFYQVTSWQKVSAPTEAGNRSSWVTPQIGIEKLKRGSHQWAVKEWLKQTAADD